ncbi:MAG: hypothetical protein ACR2K3_11420 [Nocardioides sp.]
MTSPRDEPPFKEWLEPMALRAGAETPEKLHTLLLANNCHCTMEAVSAWLVGVQPSFTKTRDIIKAFHKALPDVEVWEQYKLFTEGQPFLQPKSDRMNEIEADFEKMLKQTGLPPPL